jgi:hypothetical protein
MKMYQLQILFIIERDGIMIMGNKSVVTPFQGINVSSIKDPYMSHRRDPEGEFVGSTAEVGSS